MIQQLKVLGAMRGSESFSFCTNAKRSVMYDSCLRSWPALSAAINPGQTLAAVLTRRNTFVALCIVVVTIEH